MANDGYIRVKLNKQMGMFTRLTMVAYDTMYNETSYKFVLPVGKWVNVPLYDGSNEYFVTIQITHDADKTRGMSAEEWNKINRPALTARFTADVKDTNAWLAISTIKADYENAPNTQAKALELTENCKTDAEKIAVILNWVSKNIKADSKLAKELAEHNAKLASGKLNPVYDLFRNGTRDCIDPDAILSSKSGVCEDYAVLTIAMLRSLGIPCKYVSGQIRADGKWNAHGWVAVSSSVKDLNAKTLHGWVDADGFMNIDPTWVNANPNMTSNAANYKAETAY